MSNRRTTQHLVATALQGASAAGFNVVAADIHGGGIVRVYFTDPQAPALLMKADTKCNENDDIFETRSG